MEILPIIKETTRGLVNLEDKLSIASLILFSMKLGNKTFCKLLYTDNHSKFITDLNNKYKNYDIDLNVKLEDGLIKKCFTETIKQIREKEDKPGYLKALYQGDNFALVIDKIVSNDLPKIETKKVHKSINKQLALFSNLQ